MTVLRYGEIDKQRFARLLSRYQLVVIESKKDQDIPGSFWGDEEAGLIDNRLYCRDDTPLHSALHEACHYICMDQTRRKGLHTNAGGDYAEENGVCYLQILLAEYLPEMGLSRMFSDMDEWGYSFRLGSAKRWYDEDAEDARDWLLSYQLITPAGQPSWQNRL
ncbi:MAG: hypothetical protein OEY36_04790 [Gammaproteobacteria bacterium]|nr:hypothetical protein [Gammaproteobacteria bacterium]